MTKKRLLRFFPYLTFLFCYGLVTIVGLIPGLLYGNEMGYWLLGFWFILPWSALLCTFRTRTSPPAPPPPCRSEYEPR